MPVAASGAARTHGAAVPILFAYVITIAALIGAVYFYLTAQQKKKPAEDGAGKAYMKYILSGIIRGIKCRGSSADACPS